MPLAQSIKTKQGVCHHIAVLVQYLCYTINIPAENIVSDSANHQWNQVNIDGRWLRIDFVNILAAGGQPIPSDSEISGIFTNTIAKAGFPVTLNGYTFDLNQCSWNALSCDESGANKWNKIYILLSDTNLLLQYINDNGTGPFLDLSASYGCFIFNSFNSI